LRIPVDEPLHSCDKREKLPDIAKPLPVLSRRREPILYNGHDGEVVQEEK